MITTVTANPCIDKTLQVETFDVYKMNRAKVISNDVSGKGVNVSLALKNIGVDTACIGINFNLENGNVVEKDLDKKGIKNDFIVVEKPLRTCTKIFVEDLSHSIEVNEYGSEVTALDGERLIEKIRLYAKKSFAITLSGSCPKGLDKDFYYQCVKAIKEESPDTIVMVDAEKQSLLKALEANPDFIKPNIFEFQDTFKCIINNEKELKEKAINVLQKYKLKIVCVSLGKDGAFITDGKKAYICKPVKVKIQSIQGAGDAMVAGILTALEKNLSLDNCLKYGVALAGGKISQKGTNFCDRETFDKLLQGELDIKEI